MVERSDTWEFSPRAVLVAESFLELSHDEKEDYAAVLNMVADFRDVQASPGSLENKLLHG
jgi:hypothetical protein